MTREELKEHCKKTVESCEMWAICKGEKPSGKVYEEHKLILELLEQEPCDDVISRQSAIRLAEQGQIQGFEWQVRKLTTLPPVTPQEPILDKIRAEIDRIYEREGNSSDCLNALDDLKWFINKCNAESENKK